MSDPESLNYVPPGPLHKAYRPCPMVLLCSHCQPECQPTIISWALSWNHTFQMVSPKRNFRDWKSDPHTSDFLSLLLDILVSSQGHLDQNKSGNTKGLLRRGRKERLEWGIPWQTVGLKCKKWWLRLRVSPADILRLLIFPVLLALSWAGSLASGFWMDRNQAVKSNMSGRKQQSGITWRREEDNEEKQK